MQALGSCANNAHRLQRGCCVPESRGHVFKATEQAEGVFAEPTKDDMLGTDARCEPPSGVELLCSQDIEGRRQVPASALQWVQPLIKDQLHHANAPQPRPSPAHLHRLGTTLKSPLCSSPGPVDLGIERPCNTASERILTFQLIAL